MKICDEIEKKISLYIDGELDNDSKDEFERHISSCTECKEKYQDIKFTLELCKDIDEVNPPVELKTLILERINRENNTLGSLYKTLKVQKYIKYISLAAVACLCFVIILTGTLTSPGQKSSESQISLADRNVESGMNKNSGAANYEIKGKAESSENQMRSFGADITKEEAATKAQPSLNITNSADISIAYSTAINSDINIIVYVNNIEKELSNVKSIISQNHVEVSFSESKTTAAASGLNDSSTLSLELPKNEIDNIINALNDKYNESIEIIKNSQEDTQTNLSVIINLKIK